MTYRSSSRGLKAAFGVRVRIDDEIGGIGCCDFGRGVLVGCFGVVYGWTVEIY